MRHDAEPHIGCLLTDVFDQLDTAFPSSGNRESVMRANLLKFHLPPYCKRRCFSVVLVDRTLITSRFQITTVNNEVWAAKESTEKQVSLLRSRVVYQSIATRKLSTSRYFHGKINFFTRNIFPRQVNYYYYYYLYIPCGEMPVLHRVHTVNRSAFERGVERSVNKRGPDCHVDNER